MVLRVAVPLTGAGFDAARPRVVAVFAVLAAGFVAREPVDRALDAVVRLVVVVVLALDAVLFAGVFAVRELVDRAPLVIRNFRLLSERFV